MVLYDTRGIGLSDPIDPSDPPSIPAQSDDLMSVIDATRATRPILVGISDGGPTVITTAHRHPRRVAGLVLINTFARLSRTDDYPIGIPPETLAANIAETTDHASECDTSHVLRNHAPSVAGDAEFRRWWERAGRRGASPATASAFRPYLETALPHVPFPTIAWRIRWCVFGTVGALLGDDSAAFERDPDDLVRELVRTLSAAVGA